MEVESNNLDNNSTATTRPDLNAIRSRIEELRDINRNFVDVPKLNPSEVDELLKKTTIGFESKADKVLFDDLDISSLSAKELEEFLDHLKGVLRSVEDENSTAEEDLKELSNRCLEDSIKLESELEGLSCSLESCESKGFENGNWHVMDVHHSRADGCEADLSNTVTASMIKIWELDHQIEKNKDTWKALQDLDYKFRKLEAVEKIEDSISCFKIVEYEGNCIKLSLKTFIPDIESIMPLQKLGHIEKSSEKNHELLLELSDGTMELKKVEIFPNDVYIGEIIGTTKSFRQLYAPLPLLESRSSLEWFIRRVQDRIVVSTLRHFVVKSENNSRYSFEYIDRDEIIIAHMVGGIDALIKVTQGWPISDAPLSLIKLKSPNNSMKEISLNFLCKVVELANSLDAHLRQSLSSFVDGIEGILVQQQMRANFQPEHITQE